MADTLRVLTLRVAPGPNSTAVTIPPIAVEMLGQVWLGVLYIAPLGAPVSHPLRNPMWEPMGPVDALSNTGPMGRLADAYWEAVSGAQA